MTAAARTSLSLASESAAAAAAAGHKSGGVGSAAAAPSGGGSDGDPPPPDAARATAQSVAAATSLGDTHHTLTKNEFLSAVVLLAINKFVREPLELGGGRGGGGGANAKPPAADHPDAASADGSGDGAAAGPASPNKMTSGSAAHGNGGGTMMVADALERLVLEVRAAGRCFRRASERSVTLAVSAISEDPRASTSFSPAPSDLRDVFVGGRTILRSR